MSTRASEKRRENNVDFGTLKIHMQHMLTDAKSHHLRQADGIDLLQSQLTFRVSVLSKLLDQEMSDIAAAHGLSLAGYRTLATIQAFGVLTAADIIRYTAYDKAAISRTLADLAGAGLIDVSQDPEHGRRKLLQLTREGDAVLAAAKPAVDARRDRLAAVLDPAEEHAFQTAIEKLTTLVAKGSARRAA